MTIENAINTYLAQCINIKKLEPLTLKAYTIDLSQFTDFVSNKTNTIDELDKAVVASYIDSISGQYKAKSLKRKIASLKAFFNYLEFEDMITVTPFRKIRVNIKEPRQIPKALSLFDMEKLLSHIYNNNSQKIAVIRNTAIFELFFATGIRISELCDIQLSDLNIESQSVSIRGKGNKERLAFISNSYAVDALREYISVRPETDIPYLFINRLGNKISSQSIRFYIKALGKIILGKHITPHMLRHTFATLLLEEGVDITYIKSFLGHSSISTTQIYAASTTYKQRQILTTLHPRNRIRISHQ
ncbi:MAG: tyrosine-type recombinase/integrase [Firmicutes bacterium]|nr:tyrosine-type recombinase/integrase [Bacillota bacterium]